MIATLLIEHKDVAELFGGLNRLIDWIVEKDPFDVGNELRQRGFL